MPSTPSVASWGCTPTVAHTPSAARATSTALRDSSASVPMVMTRSTPSARASSTASMPTPSYWTWQWESAHAMTAEASALLAGEERLPLLDRHSARVAAPTGGVGQALLARRPLEADAAPDFGRRRRHGRPGQHGHDAQGLEGVPHHGVDTGPGVGLPRLVGLPEGVRFADQAPRGLQSLVRRDPAPPVGGVGVDLGGGGRQWAAVLGRGPHAIAFPADDGRYARQQIAQVVGQVGVVAG